MNATQSQPGFSLNWGHGILGIILLFLACMAGMVYVASKQTNEMVDDHYYQKELAFQGVIDAGKNLQRLSHQSMVSQVDDKVVLQFPAGSFENLESGSIEMMRNDASQKDLHFKIEASMVPVFEIQKTELLKGFYNMKIAWTSDHVPYYFEENVFVNK